MGKSKLTAFYMSIKSIYAAQAGPALIHNDHDVLLADGPGIIEMRLTAPFIAQLRARSNYPLALEAAELLSDPSEALFASIYVGTLPVE